MNCPLLPVMPAFDDELEADGDAALDPLAVLNDPFQAPMQPVYVTDCPAGLLYV
jgi:hypothetical protein